MNMFYRLLAQQKRQSLSVRKFSSLVKCLFSVILTLTRHSFLYAENKSALFFGTAEVVERRLSSSPLYIDDTGKPNLEAEKIFEIERTQTIIAVRTNTDGAAIFLNNEYQGTAPLSISGLTAGIYELRLEKKGYLDRAYLIYVSEGRSFSYYVPLERKTGFLDFANIPDGAAVYVDSEKKDDAYVELEEGKHEILVRKFGWEDARGTTYVRARTVKSVSVTLSKAEFQLKSFSASKRSFNPGYTGSLGHVVFTVSVTAPETGVFRLKKGEEEVFRADIPEFTTWEQTIKWNGRDLYGNAAQDGEYTAEVFAGGQTLSCSVRIDDSLQYRPAALTFAGAGVGSIPAAFILPQKTALLSAAVMPVFKTRQGFYAAPLTFAAQYTPLRFLELSARITLNAGFENAPAELGGAVKLASAFKTASGMEMRYGAAAHYGYSAKKLFEPYGNARGNGLGASLLFGLDGKKIYTGLSSSIFIGNATGDVGEKDAAWKNALTFSLRPAAMIALEAWLAADSAFNFYDDKSGAVKQADFARSFNAGLGTSFAIPRTSAIVNLALSALVYRDGITYIGVNAGAGYLF